MRWRRAIRLLESPAGARVLDLGCAFGFGTRMLGERYDCTGLDGSASFLSRAPRQAPSASFVQGRAEALPFPAASFDAVICLEVLEHLADEAPAVAEIGRVLRPQGELVLSVPHHGALERWDSLNVYREDTGRQLSFPVGEVPSGSPWHRHYSMADLEGLLSGFEIDRVERTGTGLAEIANLGLLALCRGSLRRYQRLQAIYFALAVAEDGLPLSRLAYNVMIHARKRA